MIMAFFLLSNLPFFRVRILKDILRMIILSLITSMSSASQESNNEPKVEHRPSPLLVPLPPHFVVESTKEHLVEYNHNIDARVSESCDDECAVCLTVMRGELRGLENCRHVFHKDCIESWIDKCKTTCPVCRSDLLRGRAGEFGDPWRRERMMYLFGEDSSFM
ncbi:hypothetical protein ABFS83_06G096400 [Erythranthe nasuta]